MGGFWDKNPKGLNGKRKRNQNSGRANRHWSIQMEDAYIENSVLETLKKLRLYSGPVYETWEIW